MASPTATKPDRVTGLPPGVLVGPLGRRFVALLVDVGVPAVVLLVASAAARASGESLGPAIRIGVAVVVAWLLVLWWTLATRAASPGLKLMRLQLVGFTNGRPVGWGRVFVRGLVFTLLSVTVLGLPLLLIFLLRSPRYQGWHDLAANAVVIRERALAPRTKARDRASSSSPPRPSAQPAAVPAARSGTGAGQVPGGTAAATADPASAQPRAAVGAGPGAAGAGEDDQATPTSNRPLQGARPVFWSVVLDDGQEVPVHGQLLLGRNPQPRPGEEDADVVRIPDQSRTLSKSHLLLGLDDEGCFVVDRGSTNGSVVIAPDGVRTRCVPGQAVRVPDGSRVTMGDRSFRLRRH